MMSGGCTKKDIHLGKVTSKESTEGKHRCMEICIKVMPTISVEVRLIRYLVVRMMRSCEEEAPYNMIVT